MIKISKPIQDAPENGFDYNTIDGTHIDLFDINLDMFENFMDAITERYPLIYAYFVSNLFGEYSGIGSDKQATSNLLALLQMVEGSRKEIAGMSGEIFSVEFNNKITTIYDRTNQLTNIDADEITITLPTSDFKRILEHIIKQEAKQ